MTREHAGEPVRRSPRTTSGEEEAGRGARERTSESEERSPGTRPTQEAPTPERQVTPPERSGQSGNRPDLPSQAEGERE